MPGPAKSPALLAPGPCRRRAPHLPAPRPPAPSVPRGGTQGRRAETGTSRPSRAHRGPWAGGRGASVELRWPGTRGRRTRTWHFFREGRQSPRGLPFPPRCPPPSCRTRRLSLHRASCPRGSPLPIASASSPWGCPLAALSSSSSGATLGPGTDVVTNPHKGHFRRLKCKTCTNSFLQVSPLSFLPKIY